MYKRHAFSHLTDSLSGLQNLLIINLKHNSIIKTELFNQIC